MDVFTEPLAAGAWVRRVPALDPAVMAILNAVGHALLAAVLLVLGVWLAVLLHGWCIEATSAWLLGTGRARFSHEIAEQIKRLGRRELLGDRTPWTKRGVRLLPAMIVLLGFLLVPVVPDVQSLREHSGGAWGVLAVVGLLSAWKVLAVRRRSVRQGVIACCRALLNSGLLAVACGVAILAAGSADLGRLSWVQSGGVHTWLLFRSPFTLLGFALAFVSGLVSPDDGSDTPHEFWAHFSSRAAGFLTALLVAVVFLGGWNDPLGLIGGAYPRLHERFWSTPVAPTLWLVTGLKTLGIVLLVTKAMVMLFAATCLRCAIPRQELLPVSQHAAAWLPLGGLLVLGQRLWQVIVPQMAGLPWADYLPWKLLRWSAAGRSRLPTALTQGTLVGLTLLAGVILLIWLARDRLLKPSRAASDAGASS